MRSALYRSPRHRPPATLAVLVTLGIALGHPVPASAAPGRSGSRAKPQSGLDRSYAFVAEGDAAFDRGDYEEAIAKYSAAYYVLTAQERASYAGSIPVRNAMRAYDRQVAQELGRALLDRQLGFVTEYLETVEEHPDVPTPPGPEIIAELEQKRDKIEKKIADLSAMAAPEAEGDEADEGSAADPSPPSPEADETTMDRPPPPSAAGPSRAPAGSSDEAPPPGAPSRVGIALAASGGLVLGVGAGVLSGWWTVRRQAPQLADMEPGYEPGTPERARYLEREEGRARRYLASGLVVMTAGAAVAATGVALVLKHRQRSRATSLAPTLTPGHAGLALRGRF